MCPVMSVGLDVLVLCVTVRLTDIDVIKAKLLPVWYLVGQSSSV